MTRRVAYLNCFSGISGDMALAAMLDAGMPLRVLREGLALLGLKEVSLRRSRVSRHGISATRLSVVDRKAGRDFRRFEDIAKTIASSRLSDRVKEQSMAAFTALARAESKIHRMPLERVHFHEVGAVDTIVDIAGFALGLEHFGVERIACSELTLGGGTVRCQHGVLPVPAPATLEILRGVPVRQGDLDRELVTPTGAALVASLASEFGPMPPMTADRVGYGAGEADDPRLPNLLRLVLGEAARPRFREHSEVVEATIDDMNPEFYGHLTELLFERGARDVVMIPAYMKKGRPGVVVQVIADAVSREDLIRTLLTETTTIGVRFYPVERAVLDRRTAKVRTRYGPVTVKFALDERGEVLNRLPEYEDCRALAVKKGVPLKTVYDQALRAAMDLASPEPGKSSPKKGAKAKGRRGKKT